MKISELRSGQGNVEVEGVISELGDTRAFNKYGRELKVANAILKDDSGAIKLTLWNDDVMRFKEGDRIKIVNGYVGEFQGEKQLTSGKFGRMEKVIDKASSDSSESENSKFEENKTSSLSSDNEGKEIKEGVDEELKDSEAKSKKAKVSKKKPKEEDKASSLSSDNEGDKASSLPSDNEGHKASSLPSDNEGQDEFSEEVDDMPEEENLKEEVKEDY